nr:DUF1294 domain-containing protein [Mobilisporobacter senegalensis]
MFYILISYIIIINCIGFAIMGYDKQRAKRHEWRVKERTIFAIGYFGGCLGILLGMSTFRHKTKHKKFVYGIPFILFLQLLIIAIIFHSKYINPNTYKLLKK